MVSSRETTVAKIAVVLKIANNLEMVKSLLSLEIQV